MAAHDQEIDSLNYQTEIWLQLAKLRNRKESDGKGKHTNTDMCIKEAVKADLAASRKQQAAQLVDKLSNIKEQMTHDRKQAKVLSENIATIKSLARTRHKTKDDALKSQIKKIDKTMRYVESSVGENDQDTLADAINQLHSVTCPKDYEEGEQELPLEWTERFQLFESLVKDNSHQFEMQLPAVPDSTLTSSSDNDKHAECTKK